MKLRNKKTGEFGRFMMCHDDDKYPFYIEAIAGSRLYYHNFGEVLEAGWDIYIAPQEPLIKDEKIRKAVQAWAEANRDVCKVIYGYDYTNKAYCEIVDTESEARIRFNFLFIKGLNTCDLYTIVELCGEKEE